MSKQIVCSNPFCPKKRGHYSKTKELLAFMWAKVSHVIIMLYHCNARGINHFLTKKI